MQDNIFITYAHTDSLHREEVIELATRLRGDGLPVTMDEFLEYGESISKFMEQSIDKCQKIIMISNQEYEKKANNRKGGVGTEVDILSFKLENKNILPIVIRENDEIAIPNIIIAKKAMIVNRLQDKYKEILDWCYEVPKKPPLGKMPENIITKKKFQNKLIEIAEENCVGIFLLNTDEKSFLDLLVELDIEEQKKVLQSLYYTYSQDTGYGGYENYTIIGSAMFKYIEKLENKECGKIALDILEGCSTYRFELEKMLKLAKIKVVTL